MPPQKPKPSEKRISNIADILTSDHPEHVDLVVVRAAVSRVLHDDALISNDEAVKRALAVLNESANPVDDGTAQDRAVTAAAVEDAKAQDDEGENATTRKGLDDAKHGDLIRVEDLHPEQREKLDAMMAAQSRFTPPTVATPAAPAFNVESVPRNIGLKMTLAEAVEAGYDGLIFSADVAYMVTLAKPIEGTAPRARLGGDAEDEGHAAMRWNYSIVDVKRLAPSWKHADGSVNHKALRAAMESETVPNIPGCMISERSQ